LAWNRLLRPGVGSSLSGLCRSRSPHSLAWPGIGHLDSRSRLLSSSLWAGLYRSRPLPLSLGRPLQESAPCLVDSLGVPLGVQQSAWAECGRSRLLTSLARPGVGCSPLCLGQESDPCSSVWPGCRSLHWLVCAGGLVFGCLLQWSSFCLLLVVNSWLHWCLPQSVHHSAHLVCAPPAVLPDLLHLLWDSPLWQSTVRPFTSSVRPSLQVVSVSALQWPGVPSAHSLSGHSQFRWSPQVTPVWTPSVGHSSVDSLSRSLPVPVRSLSTRFILRFYDLASLYFY